MADKLVRLGLGLVVWLWLARSAGPEAFGSWSYAIAFAALFAAVAGLGLDGIVQRELVAPDADHDKLVGTALALRMGASVLCAVACVIAAALLRPNDSVVIALIALNALAFVFQSGQVLDFHFQARLRARPAVLAVNAAYLVATVVRLWLLLNTASLLWMAATLALEAALASALLVLAYRGEGFKPSRWRASMRVARRLASESWPLLASGLAVMIYMRIDQVMLATLGSDAQAGQFAAALRISEVWYFVPGALATAAFPVLLAKRSQGPHLYEQYLQSLYDSTAWIGIATAVALWLSAPQLIDLLYGAAYREAASVLRVQIWAGVAAAMSFVHGKWLLAEGLQRLGLYYTLIGCLVNVTLNVVLIPRYGAIGAAWSTLASQLGVLPVQLLFPRGRRNFVLMLRSLGAPMRLLARRRATS